jgi:hypothetical protein
MAMGLPVVVPEGSLALEAAQLGEVAETGSRALEAAQLGEVAVVPEGSLA